MPKQPSPEGEKKVDPRSKGWIKPGEVRNPKGRAKGCRNRLGEDFIQALQADFAKHGAKTIETVREDRPQDYLKVIASILPKELNVRTDALNELPDDELVALLDSVRSLVASGALAAPGSRDEATPRH